ncbi:MAG: carboxylate--amine ligase [Verrucomicrobiia bacterium]
MTGWEKLRLRVRAWWLRLTCWEFWPPWIFYIPVALNVVRLSFKHRGITLPLCTNPGKYKGCHIGESKGRSLELLYQHAPEYIAESWLIQGESVEAKIAFSERTIKECAVEFPFILKPDDGNRGSGVKVIRTHSEAREYLSVIESPVVMQRYVAGPKEAGVFYIRHPNEEVGRIFAITEKIFPEVAGDGRSTLEELIWRDPRAFIIAVTYCERFRDDLQTVLKPGEKWRLVNAGNHAQGCIFYDGMRLASDALLQRLDKIGRGYPDFYLGRYDVRYEKDEDLMAGKNFKILEVNGALSEATSIYEPGNSLFSAYRTLFEQWEIVYEIGAENRRYRHAKAPDFKTLWRKARTYKRQRATHPAAD